MKKSSDNTNRPRTLEEVFRDGFEPAEVSPRASIWHHIEQELEVKQAGYYKKRLVWYRSVAAASITLLLVAASYFWYDTQTAHKLNLPAASPGAIVQNNSPQVTEEIARTNTNNPPEQRKLTENLKKQPLFDQFNNSEEQVKQTARMLNKGGKKSSSPASATNPAQLASAQTPSSERFFGFAKRNAAASKINPIKIDSGTNNLFTPENELAINQEPAIAAQELPIDSASVLMAQTESTLKTDSAAVITAATMPEETKKKNVGSRWAIGGGTGSQYFEQNMKFANAANRSFANSALAYSNAAFGLNNKMNPVEEASKEFNENTRSAFSYRAAVAANYRLNDKWSIEAGLNFAENKAQTSTSYIIYKRAASLDRIANVKSDNAFLNLDNSATPTVTIPVTIFLARLTDTDLTNSQITIDQVEPFNMYYRYRQIGVPLRVRYQHGRGKWFNFVQAGGAFNMLLQTSILSDSPKVPAVEYSIGQASPFRKWYITGLGSLGRGLKLSEAWQLQGSIDLAYSFSTLALSPDQIPNLTQQKPYYVGFGLSSSYVIGKK